MAEDFPDTWLHQWEEKGVEKTVHFHRQLPANVPAPGMKALPQLLSPGGGGWGSLEHTAAEDEVIGTTQGVDEFTGERKKNHVTFLSCLKSLSFRVQEGIVALTLFFGRRVAACQRQLRTGLFALHAVSGLEGSSSFAQIVCFFRVRATATRRLYSPFNLFPTPPFPWLTLGSLVSFPDKSSRLIPI